MAAALVRQTSRSSHIVQKCSRLFSVGHRDYADMAFTFASPYDVYYKEAKVKQVDVPTFSGNFGILPAHVPTLAVLKPGLVHVQEEDGTLKKYFVSSGSVTINDDSSVQVLAEEAHPVDRFDPALIREALSKAQHDLAAASSEVAKAEAQVALECLEALQKSLD